MAEALIGLLISAVALSSFLLSIEAVEKSFRNAAKYSLTNYELDILNSANLNTKENLNKLNADIENFPQKQ
tara:strand:- start:1060 stop:1272 length:213 start_codon:yes stop_codon:yes gene_type:complete